MGTGVLSAKDPNVSASSIIWSLGHVLVLSQLFFGAGTFLFLLYLVREWKTWVIIPSLPARCVRSNGVIKWGWVITTPKHICTKTWECPDTSKAIWSSYSLSIENKEICSYYKKCKNCLEYFLGTIISLVPLSFSHNVKKTCFSWGNVSPGFELKGTFDGLKGWFSLSSL